MNRGWQIVCVLIIIYLVGGVVGTFIGNYIPESRVAVFLAALAIALFGWRWIDIIRRRP